MNQSAERMLLLLVWTRYYFLFIATANAFSLVVLDRNNQLGMSRYCSLSSCPLGDRQHQSASCLHLSASGRGEEGRESTTKITKVLVVGAGISGLSVAYHLQKFCSESTQQGNGRSPIQHFDIEILEGRHEIGGRIRPFRIDDGGDGSAGDNGSVSSSSSTTTTVAATTTQKNTTPTWIDLGAQWVHESTPQNPIRRLLEDDLDLGFVGDGLPGYHSKRGVWTNVLFDPDGARLDEGIVQRARTIFYKARNDAERETVGENHPATVSLRDLLDSRTEIELISDRRLKPPRNRNTGLTGETRTSNQKTSVAPSSSFSKVSWEQSSFDMAMNYFVDRTEGHEGGRFHEIAAHLVDDLYEGSGTGPDRVVKGSFKSLLDGLCSRLGIDGKNDDEDGNSENDTATTRKNFNENSHCRVRLRCNTRVEKIKYGNHNSSGNKKISVTVVENQSNNNDHRDTSAMEAKVGTQTKATTTPLASVIGSDFCVCTVPLGVLQQGTIEFVPPLSDSRQDAIAGIGMGLLNKIVFRFDFDEKDQSHNSSSSSSSKSSSDAYKFWGNLKQFGICHEDPSRIKSYFDCTEDYYPATAEENRRTTKPAILVQFLSGAAADRVDPSSSLHRGLTDEEAIVESLAALRSVFGKENVPDPSATKVTRWREDPWSRGSYSFPKTGSTAKMYDEIASPICDRLLFAGEHTSKELQASVHGAWDSGAREARRIWERTRKNQP